MLREQRRFFLWTSLAALALRLFFFIYFPAVTDDSRVYLDLAQNWLQHGVYGQTELGQIVPSDTRLPGYPAFLAAIFGLFGLGNIRAVLIVQILVDLVTCLIIADLARRTVSGLRAAKIACLLAAVCPFLANYASAVLTETLEIFFTALALDCGVAALDRMNDWKSAAAAWPLWAATGASIGACILLRPDGGILLAAVALYVVVAALKGALGFRASPASLKRCPDTKLASSNAGADTTKQASPRQFHATKTASSTAGADARPWSFRRLLAAEMVVVVLALAPLAPWTIRNFRTLHHFQPLAPRYANASEELAPRGFNRWVRTWTADYASVEEIYWNVPGDKIDSQKLPARALDAAREATLALIADYNQAQQLTPQIDARFSELAGICIRAHPIRYYVALPVLRIADMWLRPRTELLPSDVRWWEFNDDTKGSALAVGLGLLNLAYVAAALLALIRRHSRVRYLWLLIGFLLLRSAFLGTIGNPEPRYTLECYPVIIVLAAALLASWANRLRAASSTNPKDCER